MQNKINLDRYGGAGMFQWDHDQLVRVLTAGNNAIVKGLYLKNAFRNIRRGDFVPEEFQELAYRDSDIELGYGENMDQPTIIAKMLELLKPKLGGTYLDIGTGSGWVSALLGYAAGASGNVYSMERIQFIAEIARKNLQKYPNINNIEVIFKDGSEGLPEHSPFDGIHLAAAFDEIPEILLNQLKIGGRLVGPTLQNDVRVVERQKEDQFRETIHQGFYFKEIEKGII